MKQTSVGRIGRSQLIPGVRRTYPAQRQRRAEQPGRPVWHTPGVIMSGRLSAIAVVLCSASAFPSESRAVAVGSRVRVSAPEGGTQPLIGSVVALEPHAVLVQGKGSGTPTRVVLGPTTTIEVSGGRRSKAGRGAVFGAAVGVLPGLLMTFGDYDTDPEHSPGKVAAVGAAAGAAVGAAVGWALKSEQWLPAEMPSVTTGIVPLRGGVGLSVHVAWGKRQRQ
jgi:hypothetical protein